MRVALFDRGDLRPDCSDDDNFLSISDTQVVRPSVTVTFGRLGADQIRAATVGLPNPRPRLSWSGSPTPATQAT